MHYDSSSPMQRPNPPLNHRLSNNVFIFIAWMAMVEYRCFDSSTSVAHGSPGGGKDEELIPLRDLFVRQVRKNTCFCAN